jgi:predicted ATPase/signal transduction histidine kinase/tRNA A-37 threonylcarbamoyl transferase component Bud32
MVPGAYKLGERLYAGPTTLVQRGVRVADGRAVVIKRARGYAGPEEQARLRREFALLQRFDDPSLIRAVDLVDVDGDVHLVLEDFGGVALSLVLRDGPLSIERTLMLGLSLVRALEVLHGAGLIHRDIKPDNVLVDPGWTRIAVADLGVALDRGEARRDGERDLLEGTLAYVSPEQTGRTAALTDYRSDYYGLGVTLYRAVTGELPLCADDHLGLVHAHMARVPTPAAERRPELPLALSDVIMKLLEKSPDARYQSAAGLRSDLDRCLGEWRTQGSIRRFTLGRRDRPARLRLGDTLHGRADDIAAVRRHVEASAAGERRLLLLRGPAGVGKSAVAHAAKAMVTAGGGLFAVGKFEQLEAPSPFEALLQALDGVLRQLLALPAAELATWRAAIAGGLGPLVHALVEPLPLLRALLDEDSPKGQVFSEAGASPFEPAIAALLKALRRPSAPLVVLLDDLQWADPATLAVVTSLLRRPDAGGILWIGAYRPRTLDADAPLARLLAEIADDAELTRLGAAEQRTIGPLTRDQTVAVIAEALAATPAEVAGVADDIYRRTEGNPLFVRELLRALHDRRWLLRDADGTWRCDDAGIADAGVGDDVGTLLSARVAELDDEARSALRIAACVGNRFSAALVATVRERPPAAIDLALARAEARELIAGSADDRRFVHDKVQEAAAAELDDAARRRIHRAIGRALLDRAADERSLELEVTACVHLNQARAVIDDADERLELAELNRRAAARAWAVGAPQAALEHAQLGLAVLPADAWKRHHDLAFALRREEIVALHLGGDVDGALARMPAARARARDDDDNVALDLVLSEIFTSESRYREALDAGFAALRRLGVRLPRRPHKAALLRELAGVLRGFGGRALGDLVALPELDNPHIRRALGLLVDLMAPAVFTDFRVLALLILRAMRLTQRHGVCDLTAAPLSTYAAMLGLVAGKRAAASEGADMTLALCERYPNPRILPKALMNVAVFNGVWSRPLREVNALLERGLQTARRHGEYNYGTYMSQHLLNLELSAGRPLRVVRQRNDEVGSWLRFGHQQGIAPIPAIFAWALAVLTRDRERSPEELAAEEDRLNAVLDPTRLPLARYTLRYLKLFTSYLLGDYAAIPGLFDDLRRLGAAVSGSLIPIEFAVYRTLYEAAVFADRSPRDRRAALRRMRRSEARLDGLRRDAPDTFTPRYWLCRAERERCVGDDPDPSYRRAIAAAERAQALHLEALAHELAARWAAKSGNPAMAGLHAHAARRTYRRWGARALAERVERELRDALTPWLAADDEGHAAQTTHEHTRFAGATTGTRDLDVMALIKASQTISREIVLDRLVRALVRIVMESAGAERCCLLLAGAGGLALEAVGEAGGEIHEAAPPLDQDDRLVAAVVRYVARSGDAIVLHDATTSGPFVDDPQVRARRVRSLLCMPIVYANAQLGMLYLENNLRAGTFTRQRLALLRQLSSQIAISIENARLYRRLEEARAQAEAGDRAKTAFLLNMSHELRTPMNAVLGYSELVREAAEDGDTASILADVRRIERASNRLLRTLSGVLELARLASGEPPQPRLEAVDLAAAIAEAEAVVADTLADSGAAIEVDAAADASARADPTMLRFCLVALLDNAARFTGDGRVRVTIRPGAVTIADAGPGIADADRPALFAPFDQIDPSTTRAHEGSGVSLAVTRRFCALMGGALDLESVLGVGSSFTVRLPAGDDAPPPARA